MGFKEHLQEVLLTYPSLYKTILPVYNHIFLTIGNGYEWMDGNLVYNGEESFCKTKEESLNRLIEYYFSLVKDLHSIHLTGNGDETFNNLVDCHLQKLKEYTHNILNVENQLEDFSVPENYEFRINKYSIISNIPDNVNYELLIIIKQFLEIIENNKDKLRDKENLFNSIKERVNYLYNNDFKNNRLERLKNFLRNENLLGMQVFAQSGIDQTETVYEQDGIIVEVNYYYDYVEIYGLTNNEYKSIVEIDCGFEHIRKDL